MVNSTTTDRIRLKSGPYWLFKRPVYHSFFWGLCWGCIVLIDRFTGASFWPSAINASVHVFFFGVIVYVNIGYLIPNYLTRSRFLNYIGLLLATAIIVTPIKILVLYFLHGTSMTNLVFLRDNQLIFFLGSLLFAFGSTFLRMMTDWIRHLQERRELENQRMQSELNFLKTQINPHFLFNTLNSLYALTLRKSDKAPEIVVKLSEMLRYMLYECNEPVTPLEKEMQYLQNYLELEQLRHGPRLQLEFIQTGTISSQQVAPLLLIPFVENAFKHGISHAIDKGFVAIHLDVQPDNITLKVKNSKSANRPAQQQVRSGGIGLVNVRRRLALLYPDRYTLEVEDAPSTYAITMNIQLLNNDLDRLQLPQTFSLHKTNSRA